MAWIDTPGLIWPPRDRSIYGNGVLVTIDATGEKAAWVGRVWWQGTKTGTKNISRVHFQCDGLTKAGGSAWTISLQDVSISAGPPGQPDGTQDQTVALSNAAAATGWNRSGTLSASRTVSFNDWLACVIEFDGAGRLGADAISPTMIQTIQDNRPSFQTMGQFTGSWANQGGAGCFMLEFDDGTYGQLDGHIPASSQFANDYNSASTNEQAGAKFTAPFTAKVEGWMMQGQSSSSAADFDMKLIDSSNTVLASASFDANTVDQVNVNHNEEGLFTSEAIIVKGQTYRLVKVPTTTNNVKIRGAFVNQLAYLDAWPGGRNMTYTERDGAGAWSDFALRIGASLRISAILDGLPFTRLQLGM